MFKLFSKQKKVISLYINEDICTGCGNCVIRYKRNVFVLIQDKNRYRAIVASPEVCKGCSHCLEVCESGAIDLVKQARAM